MKCFLYVSFLLVMFVISPVRGEVVFDLDFNNGFKAKGIRKELISPVVKKDVKLNDSKFGKALLANNLNMRLVYPGKVVPKEQGSIEILLSSSDGRKYSKLFFLRSVPCAGKRTSTPAVWLTHGRLRMDVGCSDPGRKSYVSQGWPVWKKDKWHLITGTWNRKTGRLQIFMDGKLQRSNFIKPWYQCPMNDFSVGYGQSANDIYPAMAEIASVRIYDEAMCGADIEKRAIELGILPEMEIGPRPNAKWKNSLKPHGKSYDLALSKNGKTDYTILIASSADPRAKKAALDLSQWLELITDAKFHIESEVEYTGVGPVISVGRTELFKKEFPLMAGKELSRDGYGIAIKNNDIFLWGSARGRGCINSVYALLEEDIGCRWYDRHSVMVNKQPTLKCDIVPRTYQPVLEVRNPHFRNSFDADWSIRNRTSASPARVPAEYGGQLDYVPGFWVHTFDRLLPMDKYYKGHPEYYSNVQGSMGKRQLCMTNPEVRKLVIKRVRQLLDENPDALLISVDPNDGVGYCECENCRKIYNREGKTHSAALLDFVNAVADGIKDDYPDVKVVTLAYLDTFMPPKTIKPRDNVVIRLCTDQHSWPHQFMLMTETEKFQKAMKAWSDLGANIHIWDYVVNFRHYLTIMPNMPVITENFRWMIDHNAKGILLQGNTQGYGSSRANMKCWIWGKQLWNPEFDTRELMDDFIYGYYGEAADPIKNYNDMLWNLWEYEHKRAFSHRGSTTPTSEVFRRDFFVKATKLFNQAESLAKDPEILRRVQVARLPLMYVKLEHGKGYLPGEDYYALCDKFEAITKANGIYVLTEEYKFRGQNHIPDRLAMWRGMADLGDSEVKKIPIGKFARFKTDPKKIGEKQKWFNVNYPERDWGCVNCGYFWDIAGYKNFKGDAWYRICFNYPKNFSEGRKVRMLFGGVDEECEIWLNGKKVFEHTLKTTGLPVEKIWKKPFIFDPVPYLKLGENVMVVKVHNSAKAGGIWKPIYLVAVETEHEPVAEAIINKITPKKKKGR